MKGISSRGAPLFPETPPKKLSEASLEQLKDFAHEHRNEILRSNGHLYYIDYQSGGWLLAPYGNYDELRYIPVRKAGTTYNKKTKEWGDGQRFTDEQLERTVRQYLIAFSDIRKQGMEFKSVAFDLRCNTVTAYDSNASDRGFFAFKGTIVSISDDRWKEIAKVAKLHPDDSLRGEKAFPKEESLPKPPLDSRFSDFLSGQEMNSAGRGKGKMREENRQEAEERASRAAANNSPRLGTGQNNL